MMNLTIIEWADNCVRLLDQRKLPHEEVYVFCRTVTEVSDAIRTMTVRGAPAIGVTGAMGLALAAVNSPAKDFPSFLNDLKKNYTQLLATRPTAVNLRWALDRMIQRVQSHGNLLSAREFCVQEAKQILIDDIATNRKLGQLGQTLLPKQANILTHCNAGALATAGFGTALGVIYAAAEAGKKIHVFVDETRPYLQGARLTAWELQKNSIDCTLITDSMAGWIMKTEKIDAVIVGADRIAANGDVANKIGTYSVAVLAREHGIPFYVAAPLATIDLKTASGEEIPIEERSAQEVIEINNRSIAPTGIKVRHPAFDITPNRLVTALISEAGIAEPNYQHSLKQLFEPLHKTPPLRIRGGR